MSRTLEPYIYKAVPLAPRLNLRHLLNRESKKAGSTMHFHIIFFVLVLADSALSASSHRSTVYVTVTSTTTILPNAAAVTPIVTVVVTEYTTTTPGTFPASKGLPPHTVSNLSEVAPTYSGIPKDCVMICPARFSLPSAPACASNKMESSTSHTSTGAVSMPTSMKTLFTPESQFKTVISPVTNTNGQPTGSATCPHLVSHSVPLEETFGPELVSVVSEPSLVSIRGNTLQ
jgi:hypothetical protein